MNTADAENLIVERQVTVANRMGLHGRPAAVIARMLSGMDAEISLRRTDGGAEAADCRSVLSLLVLAASSGTALLLRGSGPDAGAAVSMVADYFDRKFDED